MIQCIGLDIGGTSIKAGLIGIDGALSHFQEIPTCDDSAEKIADSLCTLVSSILHECKLTPDVIGIGVPCIIDRDGKIHSFANIRSLENFPLSQEIERRTKIPVYIDNDANCAAAGEFLFGASRGTEHSITITLGTGIGTGIVINGAVHRGAHGAGGESGHMIIVENGRLCGCGKKGCWEAYGSAGALVRIAKEEAPNHDESSLNKIHTEDITAKIIEDAARSGDLFAMTLMNNVAYYIALGASNLLNIFDPEIIVIGGGLSHAGDFLLNPVREHVKNLSNPAVRNTPIIAAQLGNRAGIIGAAANAFMRFKQKEKQ